MMNEHAHEQQQLVFAALADPVRRKLLVKLAETSPRTATQLAEEYPITRQGILKHLKILENAGLVKVYQKGRDKRYVPTLKPLSDLEKWVQELNLLWDERLLRLKHLVESQDDSE